MNEAISTLQYYFTFPFVQYALIVGVFIALCSSLMGVILVLKRYSFIGDSLSHVAFGALAIATVFDIASDMSVVMPLTIIAAVLVLKKNKETKISGDSFLAMISVSSLAMGYLIINIFSKSANISGDVCATLFGSTSILTLSKMDVWISVSFSLIVIAVFVFFYHKIFAITFDETFAMATGVESNRYNFLVAIVTAVIIVLAMKLVGSLLISALLIFPAISAMQMIKNFKGVVIASAIISIVCSLAGILASILASLPVGPTIVAANIVVFIISASLSRIVGGS